MIEQATSHIRRYAACGMAFLLCCATTALWAEEKPPTEKKPPDRRITVSCDKPSVLLGARVAATVTYTNDGDDTWVLVKPDISLNTYLRFELQGTTEYTNGRRVGKTRSVTEKLPSGKEIVATVAEPQIKIEIKKGESYSFKLDIGPPAIGVPGLWNIWVADKKEEISSDKATVICIFNEDSVPLLLAIAKKQQECPAILGWARDWLKILNPDFAQELHDWRASKGKEARRLSKNAKEIASFEKFWEREKNSEIIKLVFQKINDKAMQAATQPATSRYAGPKGY